jgi:NADP-reducing hydrogenase subunit HndB
MPKLKPDDLKKLREKAKKDLYHTGDENSFITILVGMGTCGIAAGARETFNTLTDQAEKMGLKGVTVKPTGCMGSCYVEPTVEVIAPGMPQTLYGKVTPEIARKILEQHVVRKQLVNNFVYDKPAPDIMK